MNLSRLELRFYFSLCVPADLMWSSLDRIKNQIEPFYTLLQKGKEDSKTCNWFFHQLANFGLETSRFERQIILANLRCSMMVCDRNYPKVSDDDLLLVEKQQDKALKLAQRMANHKWKCYLSFKNSNNLCGPWRFVSMSSTQKRWINEDTDVMAVSNVWNKIKYME